MLGLFLSCSLITIASQISASHLNVALHAQVSPDGGTVVGSVLTTDGLKAALDLRPETSTVEVFYPYSYADFFTVRWDLIIIEGWFMMIHEFIQLARSHSPGVVVLFFCLDPTFPGLDSLMSFDVNGYMTNSRELQAYIIDKTGVPAAFVMLAADPSIMQLNSSVEKQWGAVYVGAGGGMLLHKSKLLNMLQGALPYGLRLHGSEWGSVEEMKGVWLGSLPRYDLSIAYSSAHVVLASAIDSQSDIGMINNRIFEALACGSIVISNNYTALHEVAGDVLLMADNAQQVGDHIHFVRDNPQWAAERSLASRAFVLGRHTWSHRVVEILDFYHIVKEKQWRSDQRLPVGVTERLVQAPQCSVGACNRQNCPRMLWIVSEELRGHSDVTFVVEKIGFDVFCGSYIIEYMSSTHAKWQQLRASIEASAARTPTGDNSSSGATNEEFHRNSSSACGSDSSEINRALTLSLMWLGQFDVLLAVTTPYDPVDLVMRALPPGHAMNRHIDRAQKRAAYLVGLDPSLLPLSPTSPSPTSPSPTSPSTPSTSSTPSAPSTGHIEGHNEGQSESSAGGISFSHYDLLWYRSPYELQQLQLAGLVVNHFRMIRCFGVGGEGGINAFNGFERAFSTSWGTSLVTSDPSTTNDSAGGSSRGSIGDSTSEDNTRTRTDVELNRQGDIPDARGSHGKNSSTVVDRKKEVVELKVVAVCLLHHAGSCTVRMRDNAIKMIPYTLLLIGGTLSDWLDNGACRGIEEDMVRIVHVSTGHTGAAVELMRRADSVFIFHGGSTWSPREERRVTGKRGDTGGRGDEGEGWDGEKGGKGGRSAVLSNTASDVLWPLVLAATSATRIFLSSPNTHLQGLAADPDFPSESWTVAGMSRVLSSASVRLHGFGVNNARVGVSRVVVRDNGDVTLSDTSATSAESSSSSSTPSTAGSTLKNISSASYTSSSSTMPKLLSSIPIILKLTFSDFSVGRDGSCCVEYRGESLTCLIRSVSYLIVTVTTSVPADFPTNSAADSSTDSSAVSGPAVISRRKEDGSVEVSPEGSLSVSAYPSTPPSAPPTSPSSPPPFAPPSASSTAGLMKSIEIQLSLRGNMFRDEIYNIPVTLLPSFREEERERIMRIMSRPEYQDAYRLTITL